MRLAQLSAIKNSHNILFGGQSNCGGFNQASPDTAIYPARSGQYIFDPYVQQWQKLQQNQNNSGVPFGFVGFFGAELKLMQLLSDYYGSDQYMIKYAQGGTSLAEDTGDAYNWSPNSANPYMFKGFVSNYFAAKAAFPAAWIAPKVFIWWQGEDDCNATDSVAYGANFNTFIAQVKNQLGLPNLIVVQVLLANTQTAFNTTYETNVNNAKIAFAINGNKVVNIDGIDVQPGGVHLSSIGYPDAGTRIFNLIKTIL